jgi:hypothetical protein
MRARLLEWQEHLFHRLENEPFAGRPYLNATIGGFCAGVLVLLIAAWCGYWLGGAR